jgi:hypothetical protein
MRSTLRYALCVHALSLGGCADFHTREPSADAGATADARSREADAVVGPDAVVPPCAAGRVDTWITPPPALRAGYHVLLQRPRVASASDRVSAIALVVSDSRGGMGISDVLTMATDGSDLRAFFTSDVPYVIGSGPLEEFLGGGGFFDGTRLYAEVRRFDVTRFDVARTDDAAAATPDARLSTPLDPSDTGPPHFEMARDGSRAVYLGNRSGVVIFEASADALRELERSHVGEPVLSFFPSPRLSPSGARVAFVVGDARRTVHVREVGGGGERTYELDVDPTALAFLGEDRLLVMGRAGDGTLDVVDLRDATLDRLALDLARGDAFFETLDVSVDGRLFVITEEQGARLHVVRCDPTLVSIAGS